jgi:hypothetical protein
MLIERVNCLQKFDVEPVKEGDALQNILAIHLWKKRQLRSSGNKLLTIYFLMYITFYDPVFISELVYDITKVK